MAAIRLSEAPRISLSLGSPALLLWEDAAGYLELEAGSLSRDSNVLADLREFWAGRWSNWTYGEQNDRYTLMLEMERVGGAVTFRLDFHHMHDHIGVDRSTIVTEPAP
jgi:hypothetical protein